MGNKSTFIILLFVFGFFTSDVFASSCPDRTNGCYSVSHFKKTGKCAYSPTYCDQAGECRNNNGEWVGGRCQAKNGKPATVLMLEPIKPRGLEVSLPKVEVKPITINPVAVPTTTATSAKTCSEYSNDQEHYIDKNDQSKGKEHHCVCNYASNWGGSPSEYVRDTTDAATAAKACPDKAPTEQAATSETMGDEVYACIQDVKEEINSCKTQASETMKTCDIKSEKNEKIRSPVGSVVSQATSMMHAGAVNKGAVEQCKTAGYLSAAAGYGLGQIQTNCESELKSCQTTCAEVKDYTEDQIVAKCKAKGGDGSTVAQEPVLRQQAQKLVAVAEGVDKECFQEGSDMSPTAKSLLNSAMLGVSQYVSANNAAVQCEQTISAQPQLVPLTNTCATNPSAAGCPVNCATNPSSAQCTCLTNPTAAGCQAGAGSQMAGNPNGAGQSLPSLAAGGLGSKLGSSGVGSSSGLGDLSGLDGEVAPPSGAPVPAGEAGGMFNQAGAANAGGGAGTEGAAGKAKNGKGGEGAAEEHGLFGGMFQNLKNAAGSLFGVGGSGSSSTSKKSSSVTGGANSAGLKPVVGNKALRGIASNGKSCFVDAKGTEFCFGKKNMDIFKMMNAQYNNQYNTLIIDK